MRRREGSLYRRYDAPINIIPARSILRMEIIIVIRNSNDIVMHYELSIRETSVVFTTRILCINTLIFIYTYIEYMFLQFFTYIYRDILILITYFHHRNYNIANIAICFFIKRIIIFITNKVLKFI